MRSIDQVVAELGPALSEVRTWAAQARRAEEWGRHGDVPAVAYALARRRLLELLRELAGL